MMMAVMVILNLWFDVGMEKGKRKKKREGERDLGEGEGISRYWVDDEERRTFV